MSEFQRFVTYINLYEENSKVRNVGFAKIERRNDQCKMEIHMKGTGYTGISCPVYLFVREQEQLKGIPIGKVLMQGGNGESRLTLNAANLEESGYDLKKAGGLMIFVNEKIMFASQWDEKEIRRERFAIFEKKAEKESAILPEEEAVINAAESTIKATEAAAMLQSPKLHSVPRPQSRDRSADGSGCQGILQQGERTMPASSQGEEPEGQNIALRHPAENIENPSKNRPTENIENSSENRPAENIENPSENRPTENIQKPSGNQQMGNAARSGRISRPNQSQRQAQPQEPEQPWAEKWQFILENYPVLTPFEGEEDILCVRIELKDIRMLPKRYWYLGNNSFLLHGFFNYRYLVLGAMEQEGKKRWFLGVPGIFQSQEKVMAAIFGFPEYKSEKTAQQKTGQFGYWFRFMDE